MELLFWINISILSVVTIVAVHAKPNAIHALFSILLLEFTITSYFAVISINLERIYIDDRTLPTIKFVCFELIVLPFLFQLCINMINDAATVKRLVVFCITLVFAIGLEHVLLIQKAITYLNWSFLYSFFSYSVILLVTILLNNLYRAILKTEGGR